MKMFPKNYWLLLGLGSMHGVGKDGMWIKMSPSPSTQSCLPKEQRPSKQTRGED